MEKKRTLDWWVQLGETEWARYTYARASGDRLQLLGSVRRGQQVGALAKTNDGAYVQVVGDYEVRLNFSQVSRAVERARRSGPVPTAGRFMSPRPIESVTGAPARAAPVVVVKKQRRVLVPH